MWYKQSVKDRMEAMKLYRKAYPGFSYKEMVQHFNNGGEFGEPRKGPVAEPTPFEGSVGMMKAKMAYANEFGNPAAKRMVSPNPKTGMTPEGEGTHYMTSIDNYAVPLLQDKGGKNLEFNNNPLPSPEDIKFDNTQDAQYFAKHYKEVAPMMRNFQQHKYGGIQQFDNGGYKSEAEYKAHLLDPYSAEKRTAQIAWLKNNKPITYREDFKPGMLSNIPGLSSLASGNQFGLNRYEMYGPLGDLYRYYGGQPLAHNVLVESKNKPSNSKDKNAKYISLNNDPTFVNEILDNYKRVTSGNLDKGIENKLSNNSWAVSGYSSAGPNAHKTTKQGSEHHSNAIGRYTLSKGTDEKGDYISYYDKFDQGTGSGINPGEMLGLTKPFEIYDRIYIDSKTGKPIVQQHRYGGLQKFGDGGKKSFNDWYKTVPLNKADTSSYNLRRAYELAPQKDLDNFVKDPNAHLYSTYENKETGIYEFMKSKNHPTIQKELEWFNSNDPEAIKFRKNYKLDTSKDYYQYVPQQLNQIRNNE